MIPLDDIDESDYRLTRRTRSSSQQSSTSESQTKSANVTAKPSSISPGNWRLMEEQSNESFYKSTSSSPNQNQTSLTQNQSGSNQNQSGSSLTMTNPFPSAPIIPTVVYATPTTPITPAASTVIKTITNPIKTATPDIVLFDDELVPIETMTDLVFEDIGGQELINISRSDTINGQKIKYQPIKNINLINQEYNSNNILSLQKTSDKIFSGFAIKLENKIPNNTNASDNNPAYIDSNGNLIIDSINLNSDEQIEIEIALSGTIYEAEI